MQPKPDDQADAEWMAWSWSPEAIRTWLWVQADRQYAEKMRGLLNEARDAIRAGEIRNPEPRHKEGK